MKKFSLIGLSAALTTLMVPAANAAGCGDGPFSEPCPVAVPEISAMEGTAALAALAAIVLLTWERRRRAH